MNIRIASVNVKAYYSQDLKKIIKKKLKVEEYIFLVLMSKIRPHLESSECLFLNTTSTHVNM